MFLWVIQARHLRMIWYEMFASRHDGAWRLPHRAGRVGLGQGPALACDTAGHHIDSPKHGIIASRSGRSARHKGLGSLACKTCPEKENLDSLLAPRVSTDASFPYHHHQPAATSNLPSPKSSRRESRTQTRPSSNRQASDPPRPSTRASRARFRPTSSLPLPTEASPSTRSSTSLRRARQNHLPRMRMGKCDRLPVHVTIRHMSRRRL